MRDLLERLIDRRLIESLRREFIVAEVLRRIPKDATRRELRPKPGQVVDGFQYSWKEGGKTFIVRVHGIDASRPARDNAGAGWIVRIRKGQRYMDNDGTFHTPRNS